MKTKTLIPFALIFLMGLQLTSAQTLRKKVNKSLEKLASEIHGIPKKKVAELDQIAYKIYKTSLNKDNSGVVFIDKNNTRDSQLAMIWLSTALEYYNINIDVFSAGIDPNKFKPLTHLGSLKSYGFVVTAANTDNPYNYWVKYGRSVSQLVFAKSLSEVNTNPENTINVLVDDTKIDDDRFKMKLKFSSVNDLPREMIYIAAQLNHLIKTKS